MAGRVWLGAVLEALGATDVAGAMLAGVAEEATRSLTVAELAELREQLTTVRHFLRDGEHILQIALDLLGDEIAAGPAQDDGP